MAKTTESVRREAKKEKAEHPWMSKKTAARVAKDHSRKK